MKLSRGCWGALVVALLGLVLLGVGGRAEAQVPSGPLRVVVAGSEPFVIERDGAWEGVSMEVWGAVAQGAGVHFTTRRVASVGAAIDEVAEGRADVVVGPVSITAERSERVRFTQPYFQSSLAIVAREESPGILRRMTPFVSRSFFAGLGVLLLVLTAVGTLLWLLERKKNPEHFPPGVARGVGSGMWFALVTMTTVGYGDRVPQTPGGKVVAGVWMVIALLTASSLTAGIASALTVAQLTSGSIESAEQLSRRRVGVVRGTTGVRFAHRYNARVMEYDALSASLDALRAKQVDAVVFDRPQLQHYLQRNPDARLVLAHARYMPQGYGFALHPDTTLIHALNVSLLRAQERGQVQRLTQEWLGHLAEE